MTIRRVLTAGIVASLVMGMIEMIFEAVAGDGFWSPLVYIGATVLRGLQSVQIPVPFHFWGVALGLMGHMMNSIVLGLIFTQFFGRGVRSRGALLITGAVYGLVIYFVMWNVLLPAIDPVMLNLNATVFALAHIMWGAVLGWVVRQAPRPAPVQGAIAGISARG